MAFPFPYPQFSTVTGHRKTRKEQLLGVLVSGVFLARNANLESFKLGRKLRQEKSAHSPQCWLELSRVFESFVASRRKSD